MREKSRTFGNNLRFYLNQRGVAPKQFAEQVGYSEYEIQRLMDGRLFLDRQEQQQLASALGLSTEDLYERLTDEEYERAGCMECRGEFSTMENKNVSLNLFDVYCDIQEALEEEGLKPSNT